jgi:negative regulator of flagellin synthesis FlgM
MQVNDSLHTLQPVSGTSESTPVSPVAGVRPQQSGSSVAPGVSADHTEVSTAASLANKAMSAPDVRMDKVTALQQALKDGTYAVSAEDVANKIVNHMLGQ